MASRAAVFIDGANWHHGLATIGVDSRWLDYLGVARTLAQDRRVTSIRYYVGRVAGDLARVRNQSRLVARLEKQGVEVLLGRVQRNWTEPERNPIVTQLRQILSQSRGEVSSRVVGQLEALCRTRTPQYVEKQVDVRIAVDLVAMAHGDHYDAAFLLSADGDFVPAVQHARSHNKKVFAASAQPGAQLAQAVNASIRLRNEWFAGLSLAQ